MAKKKEMSQRGKDALHAALVDAFKCAAEDPQVTGFAAACCAVLGRIGFLANHTDVVALWDEVRAASGERGLMRAMRDARSLTTDPRQLKLMPDSLTVRCVSVIELPAFPADNHDHDREFCDCGDCENWRRAEETH